MILNQQFLLCHLASIRLERQPMQVLEINIKTLAGLSTLKFPTMLNNQQVFASHLDDKRNYTGRPETVEVTINEDGKNQNYFVQYTQETSFSGLKYIGETGSLARR